MNTICEIYVNKYVDNTSLLSDYIVLGYGSEKSNLLYAEVPS